MKINSGPKKQRQKLTSDELGAAGEDLFRSLASTGRLVANSSDRDKKGWDFMVQAAQANGQDTASFDQRVEWSCHVQLKSTAEKKGRSVSVKLSTFEPFAKLPGPSLLIVFRLHTDGVPKRGYVIPIIGDNLRRVLHRLRVAQSKERCDLSSQRLSFDYRTKGNMFELTPAGLKKALEEGIGKNPTEYVIEKQRQLQQLGYEESHLEGHVAVRIDRKDQLARMWLGLEPVKVSEMSVYDARFGVPIPYKGDLLEGLDELTLTPPSIGNWSVAIKGSSFQDIAAVFEVEASIAPPELGGPVAVLRHEDFTIVIEVNGLRFETNHVFGKTHRQLTDWCRLLRGLGYLAEGKGQLGITFGSGATCSFPISDELEGPDIEDIPRLRDFLEGWRLLASQAGALVNAAFTIDDAKACLDAQLAVGLVFDSEPKGYFEVDITDAETRDVYTAIYFNSCSFAGAEITYCIRVTLERMDTDRTTYRSTQFDPLDAREKVSDLKDYGKDRANEHGITILLDPDFIERI